MLKLPMEDKIKTDCVGQESIVKNESGQSFLEFVLLISVIMMISMGFLKGINSGIAKYWLAMGQDLVYDYHKTDTTKLKLR